MHATFTLHRFHNYSGGVFVDSFCCPFQVVIRNVIDGWLPCFKGCPVLFVPCQRQRPQRPAMKAAHGSDNARAVGQQAGDFECAFDGFRAAVAQKVTVEVIRQDAVELLIQRRPLIVIKNLRAGDQRLRLLTDSDHDCWMAVTEQGDTLAAGGI